MDIIIVPSQSNVYYLKNNWNNESKRKDIILFNFKINTKKPKIFQSK